MTKEQWQQIENLSYTSNNIPNTNKEQEKVNRNRINEREKRIKQRNLINQKQFDLETETVIGMTNKNNQQRRQEENQRRSRKQEKIIKKKKKIKRIIKFITLLLILIGGVVFALVSPLFDIKNIKVINNAQISTDTIISLSELQIGQNLFKYNHNQVGESIKTNPYIEEVKIKRKLPNEVEITVKERIRNFNVEFLNGYAYINNQGYILEISEQKLALPVIQGISTKQEEIVEGNRLDVQDLDKLETVIQIVSICKSYEIDNKITTIDITNKNNFIINMETEKKTIYLGDETNLSNKMLYVPAILEESAGKEGIIYLNGDINNNFKPRFKEKV